MKTRFLYLTILALIVIGHTAIGAEKESSLKQIMAEEYQVVAKLRHKLKELIERQEFEETLEEGNDAYNSFQNLEQLLRQLEAHPQQAQSMKAMLEALKEFESHLGNILKQQNELQEQLATKAPTQHSPQIPLSQLMEVLRKFLEQGQFQEARQLLNQMLSLFERQQNQLQQAIAQYNQSKFSKTSQQLNQLQQQAAQARLQEKQVSELLEDYLKSLKLPQNVQAQAASPQNRVTELTQQMQQLLESMNASSLLPMESLKALVQQSQKSSQVTMQQIQAANPQLASQAAQTTQMQLQRIQGQISHLQQQAQRLMQPQGNSSRKGRGRRGYWSEKGVRPLKFEYTFQVDPAYRKDIQELNQEKHLQMTPRQEQYLQDVIQ